MWLGRSESVPHNGVEPVKGEGRALPPGKTSPCPGSSCGIGSDLISARWSRQVYCGSTGIYRFTVTSDDGFRLYVDGSLKLDKWFVQGATTYTVRVYHSPGCHTVRMLYFEPGRDAAARLSWACTCGQ